MTTFSFYSFRNFKISPYINLKKFFGRILAPPSGRRPGAAAPPRYATEFNALFQDPSLTSRPKFCITGMSLGFGKNSRKFFIFFLNNYIFIQYQHNQQWYISYDVIHSMLPKAGTCMALVVSVTSLLT